MSIRRIRHVQRWRRLHLYAVMLRAALTAGVSVQREVWCHPKSCDWWENVVLASFDDDQWLANFRMCRATFNMLTDNCLRPRLSRQDTHLRLAIPVEKRVAVALWWLATGSGYRTVAHLFGIGKATVCVVVSEVCTALTSLQKEYIRLPVGDHLQCIVRGFLTRWGYPRCGGCIDGTHIPVIAPQQNHTEYYNRKGWHSVILQVVCDHQSRFTNINVGYPGSVHDCRVLRNSDLCRRGEGGTLFPQVIICGTAVPIMLLGDPAYPLRSWIMKGYPQGGLSEDQHRFNHSLSRARMTIECAFGRLKSRWRCLSKQLDVDIMNVPYVITACCVLHNICEVQGDVCEDQDAFQDNQEDAQEALPMAESNDNTEHLIGPQRVREVLTRYFREVSG
uniref:Putative nuclease HARBI1 n=1 Tax=Myripristis murdjan TaxID=586833 RepID=A0A667XSF7_9TELE